MSPMDSHCMRHSHAMGAFGRDAPSMTHGAGAISRSPIAAAHAEKSGCEQSAPPMYGAQSHRHL